jgi:chaperone BCS1
MIYNDSSFDPSVLPSVLAQLNAKSVDDLNYITVDNRNRLFRLLTGYIAANSLQTAPLTTISPLPNKAGFQVDVLSSENDEDSANPINLTTFNRIRVKIGYGQYLFHTFQGEKLFAIYQHMGEPVGTDCGVAVMENLIVFTANKLENLGHFLSELVNLAEKPEKGKFLCFSWNIKRCYWQEDARINNRPIESVVLPKAIKDRVVQDISKFLSPKTKDFYLRNGIPYRRSFLFYGIAGTGKTSMVQALAGHFKRNVCFLLPTHPDMTDDSLRNAIHQIPDNSIVVFEDIDALFTKDRENKLNKSALTFSGLLNALDGISSAHGQIFILTTNLRENLDNALIRNGRVDLHIEFTYAIEEQMERMWQNFYPEGEHLAKAFSSSLNNLLKEKHLSVTTSGLQHFFITQMDATPDEALTQVQTIVSEILQNSSKSMLEQAAEAAAANSTTDESTTDDAPAVVLTDSSAKRDKNRRYRNNKKNKKAATEAKPSATETAPVVEVANS